MATESELRAIRDACIEQLKKAPGVTSVTIDGQTTRFESASDRIRFIRMLDRELARRSGDRPTVLNVDLS